MRRFSAPDPASLRRVIVLWVGAALLGGCGRIGFDLSAGSGSINDMDDATSGVGGADASVGGTPGSTGGRNSINDAARSGSGGVGADTGGATSTGGATGCVVTNGGVEMCDGLDNDCNGIADDGAVCGSQCIGATYTGHAYAFCSTPSTFSAASIDCQGKSMRLARIDDAAENQFLAGLAFAAYGTKNTVSTWPWFGAYDSTNPVQWAFVDGTVFWNGSKGGSPVGGLYSSWGSANPGDATGTCCATFSNTSTQNWIDRGCSNAQPYLCEAY